MLYTVAKSPVAFTAFGSLLVPKIVVSPLAAEVVPRMMFHWLIAPVASVDTRIASTFPQRIDGGTGAPVGHLEDKYATVDRAKASFVVNITSMKSLAL